MVDMPMPNAEVLIKNEGFRLFITTHTNDAYQWIETEAPKFGKFYKATFETHHSLYIADGYNAAEVEAYLLSYNNQA